MIQTNRMRMREDAIRKLALVRTALEAIGVKPEEVNLLLIAEGVVEESRNPDYWEQDGDNNGPEFWEVAESWTEDAREFRVDEMRDAGAHVLNPNETEGE